MSALTSLVLATPIFGLSLTMDPAFAAGAPALDTSVPLASIAPAEVAAQSEDGEPTVAEQMRRRARMGRIHKILGISTWASMTVTVALGYIQYHNQYGFFADRSNTPCVEGDAVFGQGSCTGQPIWHLLSSSLTGALYYSTFALSYFMPDPMNLDEGNSETARNLRTHKILRWVHFGGMAFQILFGAFIANSEAFGLDRANDYGALQALSTVHAVTGLLTYGALTWAGSIMVF